MTAPNTLDWALALVRSEVLKASSEHPRFASPHEGYAVLLEEVDELWDHVKANTTQTPEALVEAVQVSAMGIRFLLDLILPALTKPESVTHEHTNQATQKKA